MGAHVFLDRIALFKEAFPNLLGQLEQFITRNSDFPLPDPNQIAEALTELKEKPDISRMVELLFRYSRNLHSPHSMGHQSPPSWPLAGLVEGFAKAINAVNGVYEMAPFTTVLERTLAEELCQILYGEKHNGTGLLTSGGTLGNITALLTARNYKLKNSWSKGIEEKGYILSSVDSHYSIARALGMLGMGVEQWVALPVDEYRRVDTEKARAIVHEMQANQKRIVAIVGTAGTTPTGSFDPLVDLACLSEAAGAWFHVDGAHGASLILSEKHRSQVAGIERADSLVWDAHKMMFTPALNTFLFYRDKATSYQTFNQKAAYLLHDNEFALEWDNAHRIVECTKSSQIVSFWALWTLLGRSWISEQLEKTIEHTREFYTHLKEQSDFELLHEPQCNILCFRWSPPHMTDTKRLNELQLRLRDQVVREGRFYVTGTTLEGQRTLRVTLMNPLSDFSYLQELTDYLRYTGQEIIKN